MFHGWIQPHTHQASRALWTDDPKEYKAFTWDFFPVLLSDLWCCHLNNLQCEEGKKRPEAITPKHPASSRHGPGVLGNEGMCSQPPHQTFCMMTCKCLLISLWIWGLTDFEVRAWHPQLYARTWKDQSCQHFLKPHEWAGLVNGS